MRGSPFFLLLCTLCQCATKHQPVEFQPKFFNSSDENFSSATLAERRDLESRPGLSVKERKRLLDLYRLEIKGLKAQNPRRLVLERAMEPLEKELLPLDEELFELQIDNLQKREVPKAEKPADSIQTPALKKEYTEAHQLWNKDQNEVALSKVELILNESSLKDQATSQEWLRILNLRFRILTDIGTDVESMAGAYQALKEAESCGPEAAHAGFLLSLIHFTRGDSKSALTLMENQCDPDKSYSQLSRRRYWKARFLEEGDKGKANLEYGELLRAQVPTYYSFLSQLRSGSHFEIRHSSSTQRWFLGNEFIVSRKVHAYLVKAEECLAAHLYKDASVYLVAASYRVREDADLDSLPLLFYLAHLFHAAGDHLEAMKVYGSVTSVLESSENSPREVLFSDIFPRPFRSKVDWLSKMWKVDSNFVYSIMRQESAFNPGAVSRSDARGLMQLMPFVGKALSKQWSYQKFFVDRQLHSVDENLKLSIYHLHQLKTVAPHPALMAGAYNAGMARVNGWWRRYGTLPLDVFVEMIPINETRNYIKLVLRNYVYYSALEAGGKVDSALIPFELPVQAAEETLAPPTSAN